MCFFESNRIWLFAMLRNDKKHMWFGYPCPKHNAGLENPRLQRRSQIQCWPLFCHSNKITWHLPLLPNFSCRCTGNYFGQNCTLRVSVCRNANPCIGDGSTCIESADGVVTCECDLGMLWYKSWCVSQCSTDLFKWHDICLKIWTFMWLEM